VTFDTTMTRQLQTPLLKGAVENGARVVLL